MKKYFKLSTALAFLFAVNLAPTFIPNTYALESTDNEAVVEEAINQNETSNEIVYDNSIITEEPIEVEEPAYVESTAEANNIETNEAPRGPTEEETTIDAVDNINNNETVENNDSTKEESSIAKQAASISEGKLTFKGTTKLNSRNDSKVQYSLSYSFRVKNYNGKLMLRLVDKLPYVTKGDVFKASVTQEAIDKLGATLNTSQASYNTLTWDVLLENNVYTYDDEGLVISGTYEFELEYTDVPYTVNKITDYINASVVYYYSDESSTDVIEEAKAVTSQKSFATSYNIADESTKSLTITADEKTNDLDEAVNYEINYNFDLINTNSSASITITDNLPYAIDESSDKNDFGDLDYKYDAKNKRITWTINNIQAKERCVDGVCTPENINGSIKFSVVYDKSAVNTKKALENKVSATLTANGSSSAINNKKVSTKIELPAKIIVNYKDINGNTLREVDSTILDGILWDKFDAKNSEAKLDLSDYKYKFIEARRLTDEGYSVVDSTEIDNSEIAIDYIYEKYAKITINYKDDENNQIKGVKQQIVELPKGDSLDVDYPQYKLDLTTFGYSYLETKRSNEVVADTISVDDNEIVIDYIYQPSKYYLSFVTNGGSIIENKELGYKDLVDLKNYKTEKDYYYFESWYLDEELTEKATNFNIDKDTTLYAKWTDPKAFPTTEEKDWDVSKSKEASKLDEKLETEITISLPSSKEELETTVVFVIDNSSSTSKEAVAEAQNLIDDLAEQVKVSGATVNVGVVGFKGDAIVRQDLTVLTEENVETIKNKISEKYDGNGTNIHAGLIEGQNLLNKSNIPNNRKYMILISDGLPRNFVGEDGIIKNIYADRGDDKYWGDMYIWTEVRGYKEGVYKVPGGDWDNYLEQITTWVEQDKDDYVEDFKDYNSDGKIDSIVKKSDVPEGFKYIKKGDKDHAYNVERAIYEAYKLYKEIEATGSNVYAVRTKDYELGKAFFDALNNGRTLSFDDIRKDIIYLVDKGTVVKDYIADKFEFVNGENPFKIKIKDEYLVSTKVEGTENTYIFRKADDEDGTYRYKVTYHDSENGYIEWYINEPIDISTTVQLIFKERLIDYKNDEVGKNVTDTNIVATITPVDSMGNEGNTETFEKPKVDYVIGNVIANYKDINGVKLADSKEYRGIVDIDSYKTKEETIPGYHLIRIDNEKDIEGNFIDGEIVVDYIYEQDYGFVIVHYIDKYGNKLLDDDRIPGKIGDPYNTNDTKLERDKVIIDEMGYDYLTSTGKVQGTFTAERPINVTYIYEKLGQLIVKYLDADDNTNVLAAEVNKYGTVGDEYYTIDAEPADYILSSISGEPYGKYTEDSKENPIVVIYYYTKPTTNVITHYVDADDHSKELTEADTKPGKVGEAYTTTARTDIENYTLVGNSGNVEGAFDKEDINVYYYYKRDEGTVTAYYVDRNTMQVITEKTTPGYVPDAYETAPITIDGYRYTNIVVGEETGTYAKDENIKVYYYYDPVGKVIVKYLEEGTNKVLADEEVLVDPIGSVYTTYDYYKENIDNYNWVRTEGNERGRYTTDDQEVIYYYQIPAVTGNLVVNYIDQDNNLLDSWSNTEEVGTEYTTEEKSFDGYTPKYVIGATSGTYSAGTTTVTYVYAKNQATPTGEVVVKYIENTGRKLVDEDIVISGEYGTSYTTEQKSFDGYNFVAVYGPTQGSIDQPKTTVIYMYEKVKSDETGTGSCSNNCCNCCSSCNNSCNNGGEGESTQPVINIDITINNDNSTEVNNENNNQDENNNNIENNPVNNADVNVETGDTNVSTGDTNVNVSTGDTNVTTGDNNIENNTNVETGDNNNTTNIENNPTIETGDVTNNNTAEGGNSSNTNTNTDGDVIVNTGDVTQETGDNNNTNNNQNDNQNDNNTCTDCNNPSEEPGDEPSNPGQDSTPTGAVVAYYRSLDDDILAENYYDEKDVDSIYVTPEKPIEGYEFVRTEGAQPTGTITDGLTKVYYYYKKKESTPQPGPDNPPVTKNGEVVAHYVDIYGNMIGVNKYYEGEVGKQYETQIRYFSGYRLVQIVGARTGEFTNGKTEVTYIYEKNPTGSTTGEDPIITPTREIIKYLPSETGSTAGSSKYSAISIPNTGVSENTIPYGIILLISSIFSIIILKRNA